MWLCCWNVLQQPATSCRPFITNYTLLVTASPEYIATHAISLAHRQSLLQTTVQYHCDVWCIIQTATLTRIDLPSGFFLYSYIIDYACLFRVSLCLMKMMNVYIPIYVYVPTWEWFKSLTVQMLVNANNSHFILTHCMRMLQIDIQMLFCNN